MADAGGGILEGLGHDADAAHAGEKEDAVAEVLALHQEVNGEDDDDAEGSDGPEEGHQGLGGGLELGSVGVDDADGLGLGGWLLGVFSRGTGAGGEIFQDVPDRGTGFLKGLLGGGVNGG